MILGAKRHNTKKCNEYAGGKSWSHRQTNCRANGCRASASLALAGEAPAYSFIRRSRSAFAITETELKLIAAPAIIGLRRIPNSG